MSDVLERLLEHSVILSNAFSILPGTPLSWDIRIIRPRLRLPLCILMEYKRSHLVFSEVHVIRSLVVSVVFYLQLFVFLSVFFWPMYCLPFFAFFNFQTFLCLREINLSFNKGRSPFTCKLYEFSSYVSIHSQISFHRKSYKLIN
jgi:hypothetical protein